MIKNKKNTRFFGEIVQLKSGQYKVKFMQKLIGVNQYRRKWQTVDSKEFAKQLNKSTIVSN